MSDLAKLDLLTEETLVSHLKGRFDKKEIYTYVGDILLAVNPFEKLDIYTPEAQAKYLQNSHKDDVDPHVYYVASNAYETLLRTQTSQAFVISGESGAGKTETTKYIVNHVIEMCKAGNKALEGGIQQLNPLLESFGNAKTVMNNNSSRFGKYLELNFDRTGAVIGAEISEYLLEKSRVTTQAEGEQNYHIFYYLFAGMTDEQKKLHGLDKPSDHRYISSPGSPSDAEVMTPSNKAEYHTLMESFKNLGFDPDDVSSMLRMVAGILLVGDTDFLAEAADGEEKAGLTSNTEKLAKAADLLQVDQTALFDCLLKSSSQAGGETIQRRFTVEAATDNRDALTRALYARLFGWIVTSCNTNLIDKDAVKTGTLTLGILDIFGFENFASNSLEQLCINITNEKLHSFFNSFVFAQEQAEYAKEGIATDTFVFTDNALTLELLLAKPQGVLPTLDEESRFPKASDLSYTGKLTALKSHPSGAMIPAGSDREMSFEVVHYAGKVKYNTTGFLSKNRDALSQDVVNALRFSQDLLIAALWAAKSTKTGTFRVSRAGPRPKGKQAPATVGSHFTTSLAELMLKIEKAKPHFVRCVKPNVGKTKGTWEADLVLRQLRYAGVLETVRIRKLGWSIRETFGEFIKRYKSIAYKNSDDITIGPEACMAILEKTDLVDWKLGKEKVFLKYFHVEQLSALVRKQRAAHNFIKKVAKAFVARWRYRKIKAAKVVLLEAVSANFLDIETRGVAVTEAMERFQVADEEAAKKRKWLKSIKKKEEAAKEAERKQKEEDEKTAAAAAVAAEAAAAEAAEKEATMAREAALKQQKEYTVTKKRGKMVNGGHVFQRNEQLTMRVGQLEDHWEKKIDKATGRPYFKNHQTRQTTWIDPRTEQTRKNDAKDLEGDELPYGWDEAETNGETYYIDHLTQRTHWLHPRLVLEEMRQEYVDKEQGVQARAEVIRAAIKQHRLKRRRLEDLKAEASEDELVSIEERISAMDIIIQRELDNLHMATGENKGLRDDIKQLKSQFDQTEFAGANKGDGAAFAAGDVKDVYALDNIASSMPRRLDTLTRTRLQGPS